MTAAEYLNDKGFGKGSNLHSKEVASLMEAYHKSKTQESVKICEEDIEQIETIISFKETSVELAHRQQYISLLYNFYLTNKK